MLSFLKTKNIKVKILSLFSLNYSANILQLFAKVDCNRGGSRIFFRRGCTRLLLYQHPLHPPPRSAPV